MADAGAADSAAGDGPRILHTGFLVKQGKVVKNWKQRWFVLYEDGKLRYFRKHPGGSGVPVIGMQAGTIDVTRCKAVIRGDKVASVAWPCSDKHACFALVLPHRTYYLVCMHVDEATDWQRIVSALAAPEPGAPVSPVSPGGGFASSGAPASDSEDDSDNEEDAMSRLSSALMANGAANFKRSESVMEKRLDTMTSGMLQRESELVAEGERQGAK